MVSKLFLIMYTVTQLSKCLVHGGFIEELIQDLSENKQEDKEDKSLVLDYIMVLERGMHCNIHSRVCYRKVTYFRGYVHL